jgi:glutamate N-acetyltransferase/amino-acid N-acetyltransferase
LALIVCDTPAVAAGVFTRNRVKGAPVIVSQRHLRAGRAQAIVVNSGSANACTGRDGIRDAEAMAALAGEALGIDPTSVLVASTGIIGHRLRMDKISRGIRLAARRISRNGSDDAARAIMTTDTVPKALAVEFGVGRRRVRIGGIAKGAAMLAPDLATMLCFLTSDVKAQHQTLDRALRQSMDQSFHAITVEGDTSTSDTVALLATGLSGVALARCRPAFQEALDYVTRALAKALIADAEGATKLIGVTVCGARTGRDARRVARSIAESSLLKAAIFGEDLNWGRIMAAAGKCGVPFRLDRVDLYVGTIAVARGGSAVDFEHRAAQAVMRQHEIPITIDLNSGEASATMWTSDLSLDYVRINAEYHT